MTWVFDIYVRREQREVFSNEYKLRTLLKKIKADFLSTTKASIKVELSKVPMTYTYLQALRCFRDEVNAQHPQSLSATSSNNTYRRSVRGVNEVGRGYRGGRHGRGGRYSSRGGRHGRRYGGRHGGRGGRGWIQKTRNDSRIIILTDGTKIEYHPSFYFPDDVIRKMKREDYENLIQQRREYKKRKENHSDRRSAQKTARFSDEQESESNPQNPQSSS